MGIVIESTTAPQYELDHAVSEKGKDPAALDEFRIAAEAKKEQEQEQQEVSGAEETAAEAGSETEAEHPGSKEGKSEPEKKAKVKFSPEQQEELNRIVAREKTKAREKARADLDEERRTKQPERKTETAKAAVDRPKRADFDSDEKYEDSLFAWRDQQKAKEAETAEVEERTKEVVTSHNERMVEARDKHEDFDTKLKETTIPWDDKNPQHVQASKAFQLAIFECENGPDVLYHIATHSEVAESLAGLSPVKTQLLVGKISASLLPSETPKEKEPPKTKVNPPPKTVGAGSASTSGFDPYNHKGQMDHGKYKAWRKGQNRAN